MVLFSLQSPVLRRDRCGLACHVQELFIIRRRGQSDLFRQPAQRLRQESGKKSGPRLVQFSLQPAVLRHNRRRVGEILYTCSGCGCGQSGDNSGRFSGCGESCKYSNSRPNGNLQNNTEPRISVPKMSGQKNCETLRRGHERK